MQWNRSDWEEERGWRGWRDVVCQAGKLRPQPGSQEKEKDRNCSSASKQTESPWWIFHYGCFPPVAPYNPLFFFHVTLKLDSITVKGLLGGCWWTSNVNLRVTYPSLFHLRFHKTRYMDRTNFLAIKGRKIPQVIFLYLCHTSTQSHTYTFINSFALSPLNKQLSMRSRAGDI